MNYLIEIDALINIGILSVQWQEKEQKLKSAKFAYHEACKQFDKNNAGIDKLSEDEEWVIYPRISRGDALYDEIIAYTKPEYEAYQKARKDAYNAKRRLINAVRKAKKTDELCIKEHK